RIAVENMLKPEIGGSDLRVLLRDTADDLSFQREKDPKDPLQKVARLPLESSKVPVWEEHASVETKPLELEYCIDRERLAGLPDVRALRDKILQGGGVDPLKLIYDFHVIDIHKTTKEHAEEAAALYKVAT